MSWRWRIGMIGLALLIVLTAKLLRLGMLVLLFLLALLGVMILLQRIGKR